VTDVTEQRDERAPVRKLKIGDLRLARKTRRPRAKIKKIAAQRLRSAPLSRGSVASIFLTQTCRPETGLGGGERFNKQEVLAAAGISPRQAEDGNSSQTCPDEEFEAAFKGEGAMTHERELLAQAEHYIAECKARIGRQREIIASEDPNGRSIEVAASMLRALEASLRALEKHRQVVLNLLKDVDRQ
jgi:hypothetical protein